MATRVSALVVLCVALGCASRPKPTASRPDTDSNSVGVDTVDKCWIVGGCDADSIDDDGCPDVIIVFAKDSSVVDKNWAALITELAKELRDRKKIAVLRIDGHSIAGEAKTLAADRADAIRQLLLKHGVADKMLITKTHHSGTSKDGYVSFFPAKCR